MDPPATVGVPYNAQQQGPPSAWTTELCNCSDDCNSCCLTCWCPCIAFGQIAEILDNGSTSCCSSGFVYHCLCCCSPCYSYSYRTKLRAKFNLVEEPCGDCLVHYYCERFALCQEYRELKNRGLDPAIGWAANMETIRAGQMGIAMTAPPIGQGMSK